MIASAFLTARGVNVTLAGRLVLNDVSLALSSGHLVALVGRLVGLHIVHGDVERSR